MPPRQPDEVQPTPARPTFTPGQICLVTIFLDPVEQGRLLNDQTVEDVENLRTTSPPRGMEVVTGLPVDEAGHERLRNIGFAVLNQLGVETASGLLITQRDVEVGRDLGDDVTIFMTAACETVSLESRAVITPL